MIMNKRKEGFALVEIIIASAVMVIVVLAVMNAFSSYVKASKNNLDSVKASYLAEEGIEAVKIMRDNSWNQKIATITVGSAFPINWTGTNWATTSSNVLIDGKYDRTIVLNNAYRNAGTNDLETTGSLDVNTKKVTVNVSWSNNGSTTTKVLETYITNLFEN